MRKLTGTLTPAYSVLTLALLVACAPVGSASERVVVSPDEPNEVVFPPQRARFVRFVIHAHSSSQPCLDELEVYGPKSERNLALAKNGAKASASSCLRGYVFHQVRHLNDGRYGNAHSWIAAGGKEEWAQIELPKPAVVGRVVFSRDRFGQYVDRLPLVFEVLLSDDGKKWRSVKKVTGQPSASARAGGGGSLHSVSFRQEHARFVRVLVLGTESGAPPALTEVEVYGKEPGVNVAARERGARAAASSCKAGSPAALIDGRYDARHGWEAAERNRQWLQVELPARMEVNRVTLSRARDARRRGAAPTCFEVRLSLDGRRWKTVAQRGRGVAPPPPPPPTRETPPVQTPAPGDSTVPKRDSLGFANLALRSGAKPKASSLLPGFPDKHTVAHLTDGRYGNERSWISNGEPSWAEVDLGETYWVYKVAFGSDSSGQYEDRAATEFSILTALKYAARSEAPTWRVVARRAGVPPVHRRREFAFKPIRARYVRVAVETTNSGNCRIDELEVYGQRQPIPAAKIGAVPDYPPPARRDDYRRLLRRAFLGEEYAWLKTYGRADLESRLIDYVRVWDYPRHVGDDVIPLPPLPAGPKLDGNLGDDCWRQASRAVVRVAAPVDFDTCPLVEETLSAGWRGEFLFLALRTDRLLSSHAAVISTDDWKGCGVVTVTQAGLRFNQYASEGTGVKLVRSLPVEGTFDRSFTRCEVKLPLAWFPGCREKGLRVGLGMGGRHTSSLGRPVRLVFSRLRLAAEPTCLGGVFRVRIGVAVGSGPVTVRCNATGAEKRLVLSPGKAAVVKVPSHHGPLGPEFDLRVSEAGGESYALHLFRYDPAQRPLQLLRGMVARLAAKGLDVRSERRQLAHLQQEDAQALRSPRNAPQDRRRLFALQMARRRLFFRDPDLKPLRKVLSVKRYNFEPSHNYSVILDARGGPGGSIDLLEFPWRSGRLDPEHVTDRTLFDARNGIARNPVADFDLSRIYFGYCRAKGDYYHVYSMNPDGSDLKQLTDGPFHDYWPCPLPDGGIAFISSRCRARYLCWRPQAAVLFRMNRDGGGIRPLSFANLSEWAPSLLSDGRIIWTRSEYQDKGADFGHTLWAIRPDGTHPELVFGNDIIQPNGYANGREVPGTNEILCTLISHFGDLNGPLALVDLSRGPFDPAAIHTLTPEVPRPGLWPTQECFRDPVPLSRDYFLCAHAPLDRRFCLYVLDRYGNREILFADRRYSVLCPTPFQRRTPPPRFPEEVRPGEDFGEFFLTDVYQGISPPVKRGQVRYLRVCQEVRADLERLPDGEYRRDHPNFQDWYATPVNLVNGPFGWPSYVAKASWGLVKVNEDGSARFRAPAGKVLYFEVLDEHFNELQRMRSVVQLQPGERRSCIGCHESRRAAPSVVTGREAHDLQPRRMYSWEGKPFSFEKVVQPVLNARCVSCHNSRHPAGLDFTGTIDDTRVPASYRTLISRGLVHYLDWSYNPGGCEKAAPLTFGTIRSKLWKVLNAGHHGVRLTQEEELRLKTWIDLNCPLWPDYVNRLTRPGPEQNTARRAAKGQLRRSLTARAPSRAAPASAPQGRAADRQPDEPRRR